MLIIDESGAITKSKNPNNRYFVISILDTDEPAKVVKTFRKLKKNYIKHHQLECKNLDITQEIKGSQMSASMKSYIFTELANRTDAKFNYIVIDNWHLQDQLKNDPERCFNYVLKLFLEKITTKQDQTISVYVDERNCTVKSVNSLSMYLRIALCIEKNVFQEIDRCIYCNSETQEIIQVSDIFANAVVRACRADARNFNNVGNINALSCANIDRNMYFPYMYNSLPFF